MERNNLESLNSDFITLIKSGANIIFKNKEFGQYKIIITHSKFSILIDFVDFIMSNYTNDVVSLIKIKNRKKIVIYAKSE